MADQPSESIFDSIDDLAAIIRAAPCDRKSLTEKERAEINAVIAALDPMTADLDSLDLDALDVSADPIEPAPALSQDDLDYLDTVNALDAPKITPREAQEEHRAKWLADQQGPKTTTVRRSKPSPAQIEIARYRREEGREAWNEYQKAKRWVKADKEGRKIIARISLNEMTPEQKAERKREQAAERKRKQRAKNI